MMVPEEEQEVVDVDPEDILGPLEDDVIPPEVDETGEADEVEDVIEEEPVEEPLVDEGEVVEEQVEPETDEVPIEEPPEPVEGLVPVLVTHQGQEHEVMVPASAAKAIQAQQLTANQFVPLQEKYMQLKEQTGEAPPGTTEGADGQPQFNQEEFQVAMKPRLDEAVKAGTMTEGFVSEFPAEASYAVWMFDTLRNMAGAIQNVSGSIAEDAHTAEVEAFKSEIYGKMGNLASADQEVFGELADQANRESFFEYVTSLNPTVGQLTGEGAEELLKDFYVAHKRKEMAAGLQVAAQKASTEQKTARLKAGGAGGGGGSRSKPKSKHPDIDAVLGN